MTAMLYSGGTVRYIARHSLWRTFAGLLSGLLQVVGLAVLALLGLAVFVVMRWPSVTVLALLAWALVRRWRRSRPRPVPVNPLDALRIEREHLRNALLRAKLHGLAPADVLRAEHDFAAGRISLDDLRMAHAFAARQAAA